MTRPTYEELEQRVHELEAEARHLRRVRDTLARRESRLREAEELALLGHWELDLGTNSLSWSDEIYRIFDLSPKEFGATYEAFIETVHPDDREMVNEAYSRSVEERSGYDIVHRLLLRDGSIKYVNEKCKTEYTPDGVPLRSLGTVQDITARIKESRGFAGMVGQAPAMQEIYGLVQDLADAAMPVLVQGESGTGKELVASAIHRHGPRAARHFVPVNCAALPEGLLESELFGHVKGSFTGALRDKRGRFELASDGTLFLDEIGDLSRPMQAKLLRVLQEGTFERVGDEKTLHSSARIVSATNRDLKQAVKDGDFREDLFYRLRVVPVQLPPLRERKNDIPLLVEHFLEQAARQGSPNLGVSRAAVAAMMAYSWPGNIRELQSAIQYALIRSRGQTIRAEHLPEELEVPPDFDGEEPPQLAPVPQLSPPPAPPLKPGRRSKLTAEAVEAALQQASGNKVKAAKILGVGRATLYRFLNG